MLDFEDLVAREIITPDAVELLRQSLEEIAASGFGEVRLTLKNKTVTHISSTRSHAVGKGRGSSGDPVLRSDRVRV